MTRLSKFRRSEETARRADSASSDVASTMFKFIVTRGKSFLSLFWQALAELIPFAYPFVAAPPISRSFFENCLDFTRASDCVIRREILLCSSNPRRGLFVVRKLAEISFHGHRRFADCHGLGPLRSFSRCRLILSRSPFFRLINASASRQIPAASSARLLNLHFPF